MKSTPLLKVLPFMIFCKCCLAKPKKNFRNALRRSLLFKLGMKVPKSDLKIEKEPFLQLGKQ